LCLRKPVYHHIPPYPTKDYLCSYIFNYKLPAPSKSPPLTLLFPWLMHASQACWSKFQPLLVLTAYELTWFFGLVCAIECMRRLLDLVQPRMTKVMFFEHSKFAKWALSKDSHNHTQFSGRNIPSSRRRAYSSDHAEVKLTLNNQSTSRFPSVKVMRRQRSDWPDMIMLVRRHTHGLGQRTAASVVVLEMPVRSTQLNGRI
jgi:hypothetical protein